MSYITERLQEPSTLGGLGLLCHAVGLLLADWRNAYAWGEAFGAVGAILKAEAAR